MDLAELTRLTAQTLYLVLLVSAPALGMSLLIGVAIGLLQAVTQIQEQTLSFVPKLVGVGLALAIAGAWMGGELVRFTQELWRALPMMVR